MKLFLIRWASLTLATAITTYFVNGITVVGQNPLTAYLSFALFLSLINVLIRPILKIITFPLTVLSFGIVALIVNGLLLKFASDLSHSIFGVGIIFEDMLTAIIAAVVLSICSALINKLTFGIR